MPGVEFGAIMLWFGPYFLALLTIVYACIKITHKLLPNKFLSIGWINIARGYFALSIPAISFGAAPPEARPVCVAGHGAPV